MESQLNVPGPEIHWIEATSQNRLELIEKRAADMECRATTATFKRRFVDAKVVAYPSREASVAVGQVPELRLVPRDAQETVEHVGPPLSRKD